MRQDPDFRKSLVFLPVFFCGVGNEDSKLHHRHMRAADGVATDGVQYFFIPDAKLLLGQPGAHRAVEHGAGRQHVGIVHQMVFLRDARHFRYRHSLGAVMQDTGQSGALDGDMVQGGQTHRFFPHSQRMLETPGIHHLTELGQKKSTVRLGLPPMIGSIVFPSIFSALKERCPNTELKITETGSITGISLVLDGTLDAAIISSNSRLPSSIDYINVRDVRILFYFNINEPIGDMLLVDYERIRDFPLVLLSEDSFGSAFVNGEFKKRGLQPNVILHTNQLFTIRNLLNNRSAATFLYEGILDPSEEDIAAVPLPDNPAVHIRLIWNKNHQQPNGLRDMIKMIRRGNF